MDIKKGKNSKQGASLIKALEAGFKEIKLRVVDLGEEEEDAEPSQSSDIADAGEPGAMFDPGSMLKSGSSSDSRKLFSSSPLAWQEQLKLFGLKGKGYGRKSRPALEKKQNKSYPVLLVQAADGRTNLYVFGAVTL